MTFPDARVKIGRATRRAIIALYLTPEDACDMASQYPSPDLAYAELTQAARDARIALGEEAFESGDAVPLV